MRTMYPWLQMSYSIAIGPLQIVQETATTPRSCSCSEIQKKCTPSFVFSVAGQVGFRSALDHLVTCNKQHCSSIRKQVKESMHAKLKWLFKEEALLGCLEIQPFLYKEKRIVDLRQQKHFNPIASHLSQCPQESCARLRRSLMLAVRDQVSPASKNPTF